MSESVFKTVTDSIKKNRESELFYKAFLTPIQIALKTHSTENDPQKAGCMPYGIKQVFKTSLNDNKFMLVDFDSIDTRMAKFQKDKTAKIRQRLNEKLKYQIKIRQHDGPVINKSIDKISSDKCTYQDLKQACALLTEENAQIKMRDIKGQAPKTSEKADIKEEISRVENISKGVYDIEDVKRVRCDNLISLIKPTENMGGIKVAICICMYSEDKSMLKRTLSGVGKNVETFVNGGYSYNDIGVFVIMDGIEVVHSTVEQYFDELEKENNIYLGDDIEAANMEEIINEQREMEDEEVDNFNHLIFAPDELFERKQRRFTARKQEYKIHKEMIKNVEKLEKEKNLTYNALNPISQRFFVEKARQRYKKDFAATDDEAKVVEEAFLLENYAQNIKTSSPIIQEALCETKRFCNQYVSTRDNLALLNTFRVPIKTAKTTAVDPTKRGGRYQVVHEEDDQPEDKDSIKMNLFMITKYKNRGKLSSHNWFFNGFCQELKPQFAVLLDVGLVPEGDALWKMCSHMKQNERVGGVCGYMGLRIQSLDDDQQVKDQSVDCVTALSLKLVDIQRAQQFEYHFAHLIDKPFESSSCFKFIHVLPGAFSAYRMAALRPESGEDSKLLKQYFKSIEQSGASTSYNAESFTVMKTICKVVLPDFIFNWFYDKPGENSYEKLLYDENVYLAEDRTLCMGIHQNKFDLAYLPDAGAWVDPIKTLYGLLGQRKRWINGSFFAFEKVKETLESSAGDCCLKLQILYLTFMNWMSFVAPALFLFTIHIAMLTFQINVIIPVFQQFGLIPKSDKAKQNSVVGLFVYLVDLVYVLIFLGLVFYSIHLTNREPRFKSFFYGVSTTYGVFSLSVFGVLIYDIISGFANNKNTFLIENPWFVESISGGESTINSLRFIMIGIMCLYIFPVLLSLIFCKFTYIVDILFSTFSFVFYSPTYLNILNIYALCRMDDISWGTKGLNSEVGRKKEMVDEWKMIKLLHVSKFVLYNIVVGFLLILYGNQYVVRFWLSFAIMIVLGVTLGLKVLLGAIYLICYRFTPKTGTQNLESSANFSKQPDAIQKKFEKVRQSLYTGIKNSILGIEKEIETRNEAISANACIKSSRISFRMKFGQESKNFSKIGRKSTVEEWETLSKIQKKTLSKAMEKVKNQNIMKSPDERKRDQVSELENTSSKLSEQHLKQIVVQPPRPKKDAPKKRPQNRRVL